MSLNSYGCTYICRALPFCLTSWIGGHFLTVVKCTVFGFHFGHTDYTPGERTGETQTEYSRWASDSNVKAMSTSGISSSKTIVLTSGVRPGSVSEILSFNLPVLSSNKHGNQPSTGSTVVSISGRNFGPNVFCLKQKFQYTAAETTEWDSDTAITAMPGDGLAASIRLILSAGIRVGTRTRAFTYNTPQIASLLGQANRAADYQPPISITFHGSSFGVFHQTPALRAGNTVTETTIWSSDISVLGKVGAGIGATEGFTVTSAVARVATRTEVRKLSALVFDTSSIKA